MSRSRRILFSAAVLVACVCVALGVLAILPPGPGATKANFDRIKKGMTEAEVEEILQVPPHGREATGVWLVWRGEDGAELAVRFVNKCVASKSWHSSKETIPAKLRRWLHLPK